MTQIRVVIMRGGTSKGIFVRAHDLPPAGPARDALLLGLMGSPDPMQLDGLGGTHSSTSKVMAIEASEHHDIDVEYLFAQVGIDQPIVDYAGNCGNLTAAVGAYAVDEGLVPASEPVASVRLLNRNTGVRVIAHVPVAEGRAATSGNHRIDGVPGTGAPIVNEYLQPGGSVLGQLLPTGAPVNSIAVGGTALSVSVVDAAHPIAFVNACDLGMTGRETPAALNADPDMLARLEDARAAVAVLLGLVVDPCQAALASTTVPRLAIVTSAQQDLPTGVDVTLAALMVSLGRVHHALPITGAICTASAVCIPGTIPYRLIRPSPIGSDEVTVGIEHPKGMVTAQVSLHTSRRGVEVRSVRVVRTARRLMDGYAYPSTSIESELSAL